MPTLIPNGWRMLQLSIADPTFSENSPFNKCGIPHANSTTSIPLVTEPVESLKIFPCSLVNSKASLSISLNMSSLNLNKIRERVNGGVPAQDGKAARALSIANCTSSLFAKLTSPIFSPFAGLKISPNLEDLLKCSLPLIN